MGALKLATTLVVLFVAGTVVGQAPLTARSPSPSAAARSPPPVSSATPRADASLSGLDAADPAIVNASSSPWAPPMAPSGGMPNQPPFMPTGSTTVIGRASPPGSSSGNCLIDGLTEAGLTSMVAAIQQAGLAGTFTRERLENVTILGPSNEAFTGLTANVASYSTGLLRTVLYYHIVKGTYLRKNMQTAVLKGLTTQLTDTDAVTSCGGSGKGGIAVNIAGTAVVFEGTASSAGLTLSDIPLCGGSVILQVITQVLIPCCYSNRVLLRGTPGQMRPILANSTSPVVTAFQDALLANATSDDQPAKAIFVPTAAAWAQFSLSKLFTEAGMQAPGKTQSDTLLKLLALYHMSYDKAAINQLTTGVESQTIIVSSLGRTSVENPTCPQRLRFVYRASTVANAAPTFVVSSDDQKTSGRIVSYYQTCTGVNIYTIDGVLIPCNFVNLAPLSSDVDITDTSVVVPVVTGVADINATASPANVTRITTPTTTVTRRNSASSCSYSMLLALVAVLLSLLL